MKPEQNIIDWMPESLYKRRVQLCGGKSETGNGFLMWRRLFVDNKGSGELVEFAGVEALRLYPSCSKLSDVGSHLDGWIELLDAYGSELLGASGAPRMLRSMMLNILPKELKSEILKDKTLQNAGYIELIDWCRARCLILQQETLAEVTRRHLQGGSSRKMNALQELRQLADSPDNSGSPLALGSNSEAPAWVAQLSQLVNAVNVNAVAPPPKASKGTRPPPKAGSGARGRSPGARSKSPKR